MTFGFLSGLGGKCVIILRSNNALADFVLLQETYAPKLSAKNEKLQRCPPSIPMFVAYTRYVLPLAGAEHHILERELSLESHSLRGEGANLWLIRLLQGFGVRWAKKGAHSGVPDGKVQ